MEESQTRRYLVGYVVGDNHIAHTLPQAVPLNKTFEAHDKKTTREFKDPIRRPMAVNLGCEVPGVAPIIPDTRHKLNQQVSIGTRLARGHNLIDRHTKRQLSRLLQQEASKFEKPVEIDLSKETFLQELRNKNKDSAYIDRLSKTFDVMVELNAQYERNSLWDDEMAQVGGFIKEESYPNFKVPRNICAASDAHKVFFGPWFNLVEKICKNSPHSIKAIPVMERVSYVRERLEKIGITYAATDHTGFESGLSRIWIELIIVNFMRPLLGHLEGYDIFERQLFKIAGKKKVDFMEWWFTLEATQFSGTRFTSFWNWLCNHVGILFVAKMSDCEIDHICEGDDAIIAEIRGQLDPKWYKCLCQDVKFDRYENLGDASFVGNLYTVDGDMIKDPWKIATNLGWSTSQYTAANSTTLKVLARSKAQSILAELPNCPILSTVAHQLLLLTEDVKNKQALVESKMRLNEYQKEKMLQLREVKLDLSAHPKISLGTRLDFERIFGIPLATQLRIEDDIKKKKNFGPLTELKPMYDYLEPSRLEHNQRMWDVYTSVKIDRAKVKHYDGDFMTRRFDYIEFLSGER